MSHLRGVNRIVLQSYCGQSLAVKDLQGCWQVADPWGQLTLMGNSIDVFKELALRIEMNEHGRGVPHLPCVAGETEQADAERAAI